ncbi:hypothetical protein BJY00DRAFT_320059 [Aspergillus carlsbadensis]|nr:hypothetical protein BJY00DRAFT_320059 [Aspergillus carlsbadensis]
MRTKDVKFDPPSILKNKKKKKKALKQKVVDQAPEGAVRAVVVNAPHTSRSDGTDHSTVDYFWPADENGEEKTERWHVK